MRWMLIGGAALAGMLVTGVAHAQQRLPRECRLEVRQLCGSDRSQIRTCLREKFSSLSETCSSELRERIDNHQKNRQARPAKLPPQNFDLITYGDHLKQAVDFHRAKGAAETAPPLVLFIHGGGWMMGDRTRATHAKAEYFTAQGYAYASTGYRLVPDVQVEDQARDIAKAIHTLRAQADGLGFDPDRIVLMGHSAGAHLAALVVTDDAYLRNDMEAVKGVILLDGAGYDIPASMAVATRRSLDLYETVFGTEPARQIALSPTTYVGAPGAASWVILHVAGREKSRAQSEMLAAKLRAAGASAKVTSVEGTNHGKLNRELGKAGDAATAEVDRFLAELFE